MSTFPSKIWLNSGPYTGPLELDNSSTSTIKYYRIQNVYGVEFHDVNNTTRFKVNESSFGGSNHAPASFSITRGGQTTSGHTDEVVQDGDQINTVDGGLNSVYGFLIDMNGSSSTVGGHTVGPNKLIFASSSGNPINPQSTGSSTSAKKKHTNFW